MCIGIGDEYIMSIPIRSLRFKTLFICKWHIMAMDYAIDPSKVFVNFNVSRERLTTAWLYVFLSLLKQVMQYENKTSRSATKMYLVCAQLADCRFAIAPAPIALRRRQR